LNSYFIQSNGNDKEVTLMCINYNCELKVIHEKRFDDEFYNVIMISPSIIIINFKTVNMYLDLSTFEVIKIE